MIRNYELDKVPPFIAEQWREKVVKTYSGSHHILPHAYSDEEKTLVMTAAMDDAVGRLALAQAMVEPIRVALEYQAIGRKLLHVDTFPEDVIWDMT